MVHDVQTIREDLAFMRALAQEGRRAPLLIGQGLFVGGIVYGLVSLVEWAMAERLILVPDWAYGGLWVAVTAIYVAYLSWRRRAAFCASPGASAANNRAVNAAWRGVGFALLTMLLACSASAAMLKTPVVFAVFPSLVMAVYGAGWMVAAAMSDVRWIRGVAAASFASSVLMGFLIVSPWAYVAYAAALFGLLALPGWLLMRGEPSLVV